MLLFRSICLLCFTTVNVAYSQNEIFHELAFEKSILENEKWKLLGEVNFKHLYNEPAWRRWGASMSCIRKINNLSLSAGTNGYYTFDKSIKNFFELRPWTNVQLNLPITKRLICRQRLRYEWRFFYTEESNSTKVNYGRLRYQLGFDIPISKNEETLWRLRPFCELFFIKDPANFERFSNERDFGLLAIKRFKNENELSFGFTSEVYYDLNEKREFGYLIMLGYSF